MSNIFVKPVSGNQQNKFFDSNRSMTQNSSEMQALPPSVVLQNNQTVNVFFGNYNSQPAIPLVTATPAYENEERLKNLEGRVNLVVEKFENLIKEKTKETQSPAFVFGKSSFPAFGQSSIFGKSSMFNQTSGNTVPATASLPNRGIFSDQPSFGLIDLGSKSFSPNSESRGKFRTPKPKIQERLLKFEGPKIENNDKKTESKEQVNEKIEKEEGKQKCFFCNDCCTDEEFC